MEEDSAGSIYLAFTTATQAARAARLIGRFSPPAWLAKRQFASNRPATARNTCAMLVCYTQAPTGTNWSSSVMLNIFKGRQAAGRQRATSAAGFARREDGAAALEFALVAAPFIALILASVQTALAFFAGQVLESAATDASRLILTGTAQKANMDQAAFNTAVCGKVQTLFSCGKLMVDVQTASSFGTANTAMPSLTFDGSGNVTNAWQYNPGNPGDIVVMRVMYPWPVFLGPLGLSLSNESNGTLLLMATAAFRNEPYQ
jgi:Flp pilus assembly protein TadG